MYLYLLLFTSNVKHLSLSVSGFTLHFLDLLNLAMDSKTATRNGEKKDSKVVNAYILYWLPSDSNHSNSFIIFYTNHISTIIQLLIKFFLLLSNPVHVQFHIHNIIMTSTSLSLLSLVLSIIQK